MNASRCSATKRLGRAEPLQRQFRFAAIEVKHRIKKQGYFQAERMSDALGQCHCLVC